MSLILPMQVDIPAHMVADIQNVIPLQLQRLFHHVRAASTEEAPLLGHHAGAHKPVLRHDLVQAHVVGEEVGFACLHDDLQAARAASLREPIAMRRSVQGLRAGTMTCRQSKGQPQPVNAGSPAY